MILERCTGLASLWLLTFSYAFAVQLLYANVKDIRIFDTFSGSGIIVKGNLDDAVEVDYDYETQVVFYSDLEFKQIWQINLITSEARMIIHYRIGDVQYIAVDWVTKKLYFTNVERKRVEVCNFDGSQRRVLFKDNIGSPRAIAVSPKHGLLFFGDAGDSPKIEMSGMDGSNRQTLVDADIISPVSLSFDPDTDRLYWSDSVRETVESIFVNGTGRRIVLTSTRNKDGHAFSLTLDPEQLVFSHWKHHKIVSCSKTNNSECRILVTNTSSAMGLRAFGQRFQPQVNSECQFKNGGCSHLCLLRPSGSYSCACPTGVRLLKDKKTCDNGFQKFLIIARKPDLRVISMDTGKLADVLLPIKSVTLATGVDFDPVDQMVYWTDTIAERQSLGVIKRAFLNGSGLETVVMPGFSYPDHLAVDWVARNLYWTCQEFDKIYVSRLNGSSRKNLISTGLEEPRGIVVDPGDGRIYWSDWGKEPKIEVADLDGENRAVLVSSTKEQPMGWPNGIALDYQRRYLYWVDALTDTVEFLDLRRNQRHKLTESPHGFGVTVLGDLIFWTDWQRRTMCEYNIETGETNVVVANLADVMGLKAVDMTLSYGSNSCEKENYGCSHFCFHKPRVGAVCSCPDGFELGHDRKNCVALTGYLLYSTRQHIHRLSLDTFNADLAIPQIQGQEITHLGVNSKEFQVYWSENMRHEEQTVAIRVSYLNGTGQRPVARGFHGPVGGVAIDWMAGNIYWSQPLLYRIEVSRLDGRFRKVLFQARSLTMPMWISVNPHLRKLYWFEEVHDSTRVKFLLKHSNLDGTENQVLFNDVGHPNGIAVDFNDSRLYWFDRARSMIYSVKHDGTEDRAIAQALGSPIGLAVFGNRLFFGQLETPEQTLASVLSITKDNGTDKKVIRIGGYEDWLSDITAYHTTLQTGANICDASNGDCEHLCFATSSSQRICECEAHYTLDEDKVSCRAPPDFLLLSTKSEIYRVTGNHSVPEVPLYLHGDISADAIDYNMRDGCLYWIERDTRSIKFGLGNCETAKTIVTSHGAPYDLAVDSFGSVLYWTDAENDTIEYVSLKDGVRGVLLKDRSVFPRNLVVFPEAGRLIFTNVRHPDLKNASVNSIETIRLDGSDRQVVWEFREKESLSLSKYSIALDYKDKRLFWLDVGGRKIQSSDLFGNDVVLHSQLSTKYSLLALAIHDDFIYWLDKDVEVMLKRMSKRKSDHNRIARFQRPYSYITDLAAVNVTRFKVKHVCMEDNGGCSHLCMQQFISEGSPKAVCGCPLGYLKLNATHCAVYDVNVCAFVCDGACQRQSIRCNRVADCNDRKDELECPPCPRGNSFTCLSSLCINLDLVCDGVDHCGDGSDERDIVCKLHLGNKTRTHAPTVDSTAIPMVIREDEDSKIIAGITSGVLLTVLIMGCVLYIVCTKRCKRKGGMADQMHYAVQLKQMRPHFDSIQYKNTLRSDISIGERSLKRAASPNVCNSIGAPSVRAFTSYYDRGRISGASSTSSDSIVMPFNPPPSLADCDGSVSNFTVESVTSGLFSRAHATCRHCVCDRLVQIDERSELESGCEGVPPTPLFSASETGSVVSGTEHALYSKPRHKTCSNCARRLDSASVVSDQTLCSWRSRSAMGPPPSYASTTSGSLENIQGNLSEIARSLGHSPSLASLMSSNGSCTPASVGLVGLSSSRHLPSVESSRENLHRHFPSSASSNSRGHERGESEPSTGNELWPSLPASGDEFESHRLLDGPAVSPGTGYMSEVSDLEEGALLFQLGHLNSSI